MFIKKITIQNFKLFSSDKTFEIDNLNVPDNKNEGSGINLFVGENSCGKTTLLDAFVLPLLSYKAESFGLSDFNDPKSKAIINIFSKDNFYFKGTMPNKNNQYKSKGFSFEAGIRSREIKSYLSSIVVSDQKYIKADGQEKPKDGSPDLRTSVNNPFSGSRFNENDILFLDKNRTYQIRSGTYSATRFDRLMEDFDYQYIKQDNNPIDVNDQIKQVSNNVINDFINEAISKFKEISGFDLSLSYLDNWNPHNKAFFSIIKDNHQHVPLGNLGSGYEMIFSLLYSFSLSKQSNKQLIFFIDEPELHLHPKLQEDFVKILLEISKTAQIFLTTHSPLFVKQLLTNEKVSIHCLNKKDGEVKILKLEKKVLPYLSANEINYIAFGLATEEYHNELYNELETSFWDNTDNIFKTIKNDTNNNYDKKDSRQIIFDNEFFNKQKQEMIDSPFMETQNKVTKHTYIRNKIHHSKENGGFPTQQELQESIEKMRKFF